LLSWLDEPLRSERVANSGGKSTINASSKRATNVNGIT
jgi:hypothetical protein